jgi:hypothetical protein
MERTRNPDENSVFGTGFPIAAHAASGMTAEYLTRSFSLTLPPALGAHAVAPNGLTADHACTNLIAAKKQKKRPARLNA